MALNAKKVVLVDVVVLEVFFFNLNSKIYFIHSLDLQQTQPLEPPPPVTTQQLYGQLDQPQIIHISNGELVDLRVEKS